VIAGTVDLDGITLGYRETGVREDHPVVLLHAMGSDSSTWDSLAAALAAVGRQSIAIDLRGHGRSSRPGKYTLELMVADVLGFLDARGLARVDLVGHSMGGTVAMRLAGVAPTRVRRLVIEDSLPPPRRPWQSDTDPPARPPGPTPFDWSLVEPIFRQLRALDPDWWNQVPSITAPTLLVHGGEKSFLPRDRLDELAAELPDARVVPIDAGHKIHSTTPNAFAAEVVPFLVG
jgi:pimeloyl-ACP methyl ester carboxylesterase